MVLETIIVTVFILIILALAIKVIREYERVVILLTA